MPGLPLQALAALTSVSTVTDRQRRLEVCQALATLLPQGGPRRGATVGVGTGSVPGESTLALALVSAASQAGQWVAMVGIPALGAVAAAQLGLDLNRVVLVAQPDHHWPVVTAALLESMTAVVVRPPGPVRPADARRLVARARERNAVLVVLGEGWPEGVDLRLTVTRATWEGLADGHGHLRARLAEVTVTGRRAGGTPRCGWLWLPGPDGTVSTAGAAASAVPSLVG